MARISSLLAMLNVRGDGHRLSVPQQRQEENRRILSECSDLSPEALLRRLHSDHQGLDNEQVAIRLEEVGPNVIGRNQPPPLLWVIIKRVANPLNLLLLVLAVVSIFVDDAVGAGIMTVMVAISVLLAHVQERRSDRAVESLRDMVSNTATVRRQDVPGGRAEIPIEEIVPGDVIHISAGDMLPADVRLLAAKDLFINQSSLTGESIPVEKFVIDGKPEHDILAAGNLCFMGTNVVSGSGLAVVIATGSATAFGSLARSMSAPRPATSFDNGLRHFVGLMLRFMAIMVPLVLVFNGVLKHDWMEAFMFATAVAVGLTPEMLPMIVTVNLAKGALVMARIQVIVKRLPAIQNFGAIDVLCTDKTGTLTQDHVILERHVDAQGREDPGVLQLAFLNSHYQTGLKNLLDLAVLERVAPDDRLRWVAEHELVDEIPFDFERRRMSVVVRDSEGRHLLVSKGAVAEMLQICERVVSSEGAAMPLDAERMAAAREVAYALNGQGFRVIAVGVRELHPQCQSYSRQDERGLDLVGFMAFLDPPKESAAEAIRALHRHGVQVKILTGDNDIIARQVCSQVDINVQRVLTGPELAVMDTATLDQAVTETQLFARLNPQQKVRVIEVLRAQGHVVGFLGDGINDGPALHAADVGISVDTAVDIAKESADIILLEKSLTVLEEGVLEGRKVFGNILKYIKITASSNFGNVFSILGASVLLPFLPMAPVQLLLNNLMYDLSMTTLATDEVDAEYVAHPRGWDLRSVVRYMFLFGPISSMFDYLTFAVMWWGFGFTHSAASFQTGWFVESLLSQILVVHIIRTGRIPFLQSMASLPLRLSTLLFGIVGIVLPFTPVAGWFGFTPLPNSWWLYMGGILVTYLVLVQGAKSWLVRHYGHT